MSDEHLILNGHALANEGVAGDFAATADPGAFLNLDEGPDFRLIANLAAIQIDESENANPGAELYVWSDLLIWKGGYGRKSGKRDWAGRKTGRS